jgi:hypothetical protein
MSRNPSYTQRQQSKKSYPTNEKHERAEFPKEILEGNPLGEFALTILGDEPAGELFALLTDIFSVGMSAGVFLLEGEEINMEPDPELPAVFQKPYLPKTMGIVRHLEKAGYLKQRFENERGCGYNVVLSAREMRSDWARQALTEIMNYASEKHKEQSEGASKLTPEEMVEFMGALDVPVGGSFFFAMPDNHSVTLTLRSDRVEISGDPGSQGALAGIVALWTLTAFANKHGLGSFSIPTPLVELMQVKEFMDRVGQPEYNHMPIKELIPKMEIEFRNFWTTFQKGSQMSQGVN